MLINEVASKLYSVHPSKQLSNLANGGGCWYDRLLAELSEIEGHKEEVETLENYAIAGLMSEEWALTKNLLELGKVLHTHTASASFVRNAR